MDAYTLPRVRLMVEFPIIQGGALALITTYAGWSLFATLSGRLIPRSWVDAMRVQDQVLLADMRNRLDDISETVKIKDQQLTLILEEHGKTVTQVMSALPVRDEGRP